MMMTTTQIAKHLHDIHFGGNWTTTNLKDTLSDVTWQQATKKVGSFNTIAALAYHVNYFVEAVIPVLNGEALNAHDKFSFDHPPINSSNDWNTLRDKLWADAKTLVELTKRLSDNTLFENFTDEKYGNYYRNLHGIIEHMHYHLGQIVILKKLIQQPA
jgi:hypothetical protein